MVITLTAEKVHFQTGFKKIYFSSYLLTVKVFFALEGYMPKEI
jgi:hypothetical protein